ncbi:MAG: (deoxy)nucleoside triphosphate pyrophosphohydrolase, partial [Desulfotignum sp.]|nr:(deoxy)nucleoside triphosphate pyrophosphohydrolase [Desulfotignum sp.]
GIVIKNNKLLITQRNPDGLLGGLWEFPGGKVEKNETAEAACIREIKEETGLTVRGSSFLTRVKHAYTHFKIEMDVFYCDYISGDVVLNGPVDFQWIPLQEISRFAFPRANLKFIDLLHQNPAL